MHAFYLFLMFFFQQQMRRTARQKFVFRLGNPQALVVFICNCLCTILFSVTNYSFVIVICHVFVIFFLEMK